MCFDYLAEYKKDQIENGLSASDEDYIFQNVRKNSKTFFKSKHRIL